MHCKLGSFEASLIYKLRCRAVFVNFVPPSQTFAALGHAWHLNGNMLSRAIWSKIPLITVVTRHSRLPSALSSWYPLPTKTHVFPIGITAPSQARLNFATTATKFIDADEKAREMTRMRAYDEEFVKALDQLPISDPDRIHKAYTAAMKAHPINPMIHKRNLRRDKIEEGYEGIEEALSDQNLKVDAPWGMAMYRTSYDDEAAWQHIVAQIKGAMEISLIGWEDIRARHDLVIMDDRSQFDGATIDQIRTHFRAWSLEELKRNWRHPPLPEEEIARIETGPFSVDSGAGLRYNYCIVVDDICLESVERMFRPVVKLVNKDWTPYHPDELPTGCEEDENPGWEGGLTNCETERVGWMYIRTGEYVEIQDLLQESHWWPDRYVRPPRVDMYGNGGAPGDKYDFSTLPGFWRRNGTASK